MHILHATAWYPPYSLGGTEIYVEGLVAELSRRDVNCTIVTPRPPQAPEIFTQNGIPVETYPVNERLAADEQRGGRPHTGFEAFKARLGRHSGSIYHQHTWTRGCGPHHLRAARALGMRTVLTIHAPGNTCLRGTMLKFGKTPCDGKVEPTLCGACWAHGKGMPKRFAQAIASIPTPIAAMARRTGHRIATGLSAREIAEEKLRHIAGMVENADRIVAVCQWLHDVMLRNGIARDKLVMSRQGVTDADLAVLSTARTRRRQGRTLRLLLISRWDHVKGIEIPVLAIRRLSIETPVELRICAVPSKDEPGYEQRVRAIAAADPRIRIEGPVSRTELVEALAQADVLVVPSIWLETGPLVVLEALAAGLFVLGSRRGGIAELIDDGVSGLLVEPGDVVAWMAAIARLAEWHARDGLPAHPVPVRTMAAAAGEMCEVYASL